MTEFTYDENTSRKSFLKSHPYRKALLRYVVISLFLFSLLFVLNSIFPNIYGSLEPTILIIALLGILFNLLELFMCFSVPKYMKVWPKSSVPLKQMEEEFNLAYARYVVQFSPLVHQPKMKKLKIMTRIFSLVTIMALLPLLLAEEPELNWISGSLLGVLFIGLLIAVLTVNRREKEAILLAKEIQRKFLAYYSKIGLHLKDSIISPDIPVHQEVVNFMNNARGILYYQTLAFYKGFFSILPVMAAMIIPFMFHPSEIPLFYIEIVLEIFFIAHLLWSIFNAIHAERMKKKARLTLGIHIPTYEEIYRVRDDNYE